MNGDEATRCWVLTDGSAGMEIQAKALAEAMGLAPEIKRVKNRAPWRWLPAPLWVCPLCAPGPGGDEIAPPWPDVVIGTGRQSVPISLAIKKASGGRTFAVQIQNPGMVRKRFDVVVAPLHDRLEGPNVIPTTGSIHGITPEKLAEARAKYAPKLAHLKRPLVAVLVGGDSRAYKLTHERIEALCDALVTLEADTGAGIVVTPSRRTGAANTLRLKQCLAPLGAEVWDGKGENPYLGFLACADAFVVTSDSVNMVCEAAATGKPVYVFDLEGGSPKFERFHERLREAGITRAFTGRLRFWDYEPLNDTAEVAAEINRRRAARAR